MSQDMLSNEAGKDVLFGNRHEEEPLFAPRTVNPGQDNAVTGFTYMLGDEGEEFIYEEVETGATGDAHSAEIVLDDAHFDVGLVLARASGLEHHYLQENDSAHNTGGMPAGVVDLDHLFDVLNIGVPSHDGAGLQVGAHDPVAGFGEQAGAVTADSAGFETVFSFENFESVADKLFDHISASDQS